jgi:Cu2+-containing amine oxidase
VDLIKGTVTGIEELPTHPDDYDGTNKAGNSVPREESNYDYKYRGGKRFLRNDVKPIDVKMPRGPAFKVKGNEVQWQKFKFRVG